MDVRVTFITVLWLEGSGEPPGWTREAGAGAVQSIWVNTPYALDAPGRRGVGTAYENGLSWDIYFPAGLRLIVDRWASASDRGGSREEKR